jgi:thioesterase domain-containing protein/acyl carrier protein
LGEIESVLMQHEGVASAVVVAARDNQPPGISLAAFVVPARATTLDPASLRDSLTLQLPRYMVPNRIAIRDSLPALPSGKVDRAALLKGLVVEVAPEVSAPRTILEKELLELWQEHLGLARAGIDDDFFELGGHSLLAFQLVNRIQQHLERPCTLRLLFRFPTVRQLAQALEVTSKATRGSIVLPLQANGSRPPIYCICGVQLYRELAQHFAPDVPVHGIFLPWEEQMLDGSGDAGHLTVEDMASRYIRAIRSEQPLGTFSLVGISFGGILAFEIARQLAATGSAPPVVAVLDMPPVEARQRPRFTPLHFCREALRRTRSWYRWLLSNWLDAAALHEHFMEERLMIYGEAMRNYRTRPYSGRLLVVRATLRRKGGAGADPALGWRQFATNVSTVDAPGDHLGILHKKGAAVIAREMRQWLP